MGNEAQMTSDFQLWNEFVAGDDQAFRSIYDQNVQSLFKFGQHFSKDRDLIQDCIHDLFIDLYRYRSRLRSTNNIKSYLFLSLKRKIIKVLEQNGKFLSLESDNLLFTYRLFDDIGEDNSLKSERFELLDKAMSELGNRQREAIYLRYVVGLSYDDLAEILNLNYQSARNLIYRGIEKLRVSCLKDSIILLYVLAKV